MFGIDHGQVLLRCSNFSRYLICTCINYLKFSIILIQKTYQYIFMDYRESKLSL